MVSEIVPGPTSTSTTGSVSICDADTDSLKQCDTISITSEEDDFGCNAIALQDNNLANGEPTFGNIAVSNSSGIHFGNNTYYQGPVTIKKIVYAGQDAQNNDLLTSGVASIENGKCNGVDNLACNFENGAINAEKPKGADKQPEALEKQIFSCNSRSKRLLIAIVISILAIGIIGILLSVVLSSSNKVIKYPGDSDEQDNRFPAENPIDPVDLPPHRLKIVTRREWLAQPPTEPLDELPTPVPYVVIWHTATENCSTQVTCTFQVKQIQNFHIQSRKWWDIAYNFLVGGDGYVYEGRGWAQMGSHTKAYNNVSIGIAFVGTFTNYSPPKRQIDAAKNLIQLGIDEGYINEEYKLFAARQLSSTESPGQMLFEKMKNWPHWVDAK